MLELKAYWLPRTRVRLTLLPRAVPPRVTVHAVLPTFPPRMYVSVQNARINDECAQSFVLEFNDKKAEARRTTYV